jgi:AmmeMemoRadiSam system protein A
MGPMRSADSGRLDPSERHALLRLARQSIEHGLSTGRPISVDPRQYAARLAEQGAAFVTLHRKGTLRGCIGHLEAIQPLVLDVAENAFAAAFRDPRFAPLTEPELADLAIEISVLSPSEPLACASEEELLRMIEPGRDGLILEDGAARGTFLPTVWESLPQPRDFLRHLKRKAGLPPDHWSDQIRVSRYRTESFSEQDLGH